MAHFIPNRFWSDFYWILLFAKNRIVILTVTLPSVSVVSVVSVVKINDVGERQGIVLENRNPIRSRGQRKAPIFRDRGNPMNAFRGDKTKMSC